MLHTDLKRLVSSLLCFERSFFPSRVPHKLKEFYLSITILNFALAAAMLFEPVYLYTIGFPLHKIMFFYFAVYVLYFFIMPLGGKVAKQKGFSHSMIIGSLILILYLIFLIAIPSHPVFFYLSIIALAFQKTFFWPGYHADFAFFSQYGERGRDIGILTVFDSAAFIFGPLIGGIIVNFFGFPTLFIFMCVTILLSTLPLLLSREEFTPSQFQYREAYQSLIAKENRRYFVGYLGFGEELIVLTVWPIFIYVAVGNIVQAGGIVALSSLVTALVTLYAGRMADLKDRKSVLQAGTALYALGWMMRFFARGGASVFLVDFFSRTSKNILTVPLFSGLYDYATRHSIVRTVIFFEMSLTVGKILAAGLCVLVFYFFPGRWDFAFFLGGIFTALYFVLNGRRHA
ncbi:MFS transporter [Candidatus Uhrbacteria bacterium]|nr:MFS transporter [Candidatus Uhrbacteria bacterium]